MLPSSPHLAHSRCPTGHHRVTAFGCASPAEVRKADGATRVSIDAYSGAVLRVIDPLRGPAADVFVGWLFPLHTGEGLGTPGRWFVYVFGFMPLQFLVRVLSFGFGAAASPCNL